MIKFSDKQLKIPQLMRSIYIVTVGMSKFDRSFPETRTEESCVDIFTAAVRFVNMTPVELKEYIHACYHGDFADHYGAQLQKESVIHDGLRLDPLGNLQSLMVNS